MRAHAGLLAVLVSCLCSCVVFAEVKTIHPYPLFPSQPVPGRPGVGAPEVLAAEKEGKLGSEVLLWGHPEFLAYPGAVEHVRDSVQRYVPPYPLYNQNTLVKNFLLHQHPQCKGACVDLAELVYWHKQYGERVPTSQRRPAVKVYPWKPGAAIELDIGRLTPRLIYAVRVIGALDTQDLVTPAKQLVFQLDINDGPRQGGPADGKVTSYILRGCANDNFYETVAFFFHCNDDRRFRARISLLPESEATLLTYNLDVHDVFGECAKRAGKRRAVTYEPAARDAIRRDIRTRLENKDPSVEKVYADLLGTLSEGATRVLARERPDLAAVAGYLAAPPLDPETRAKRDDNLWHAMPPLNAEIAGSGSGLQTREKACWRLLGHYGGEYGSNWDKRFCLAFDTWMGINRSTYVGPIYDWQDLADHKPLADTGDRGYGFFMQEGDRRRLVSHIAAAAWSTYEYAGRALNRLTDAYHLTGDRHAARDAAFLLAAYACQFPSVQPTHFLGYAERGSPDVMPRRYQWFELTAAVDLYDKLFDYIQGNEELAAAIGRYVPWVKTPDDVRFLFDVYLVQYCANEITHYRYYYDHGMASMLIGTAAVQGDNEISHPWMEFLFTRCWEYPQALAGLGDNVVTNSTCEGTSAIGSWAYGAGAGPGMEAVVKMQPYLDNSGEKKYDVSDFRRYPKSLTSVFFPIESEVAGRHYLGIGDVGGPSVEYGRWNRGFDEQMRWGWKWTHDPRFAYLLAREYGQKNETPEEWAEILKAAVGQRDPYMQNKSRVLSEWSGILESGTQNDDFRFRRALAVRVGNGVGHAHDDTLDLRLWAHGCCMSGDLGQRPEYGRPRHQTSYVHNVVEVDGNGDNWGSNTGNWDGYAWIRDLFDAPAVPYLMAESVPTYSHPAVKLFRRQVALVDVDEGVPPWAAPPGKDPNVATHSSYVFDVFRVSGGRKHTYCFHGCVDDDFDVNIKNKKLLDEKGESEDEKYMQCFRYARYYQELQQKDEKPRVPQQAFVPERDSQWAADLDGDILQATWRLERPAEQRMVSAGGAVTEPRKYTRLHLFGQRASRILHGIAVDVVDNAASVPSRWHTSGRCLFAQKRSDKDMDSVFTALVEPYAGEPFIAARRELEIKGNEADALRAAAVEVKTTNGHTDICFADGRPEKTRDLEGGMQVAAEFAYVSTDAKGLRQASLTGGTLLKLANMSISLKAPTYEGKVSKVDYLDRKVWVEGLPALKELTGEFFEVGNDKHKGTYEVDEVQAGAGGTVILHMRKGLEIMRARVIEADYPAGRLKTNIAMLRYRGRDDGLVATAEETHRTWRVTYEGGNRHEGHNFKLAGGPISEKEFPIGGQLSVWEFGVGDTVTLKAGVSLRRLDGQGVWEAYANAPFSVQIADAAGQPAKLEGSADGKTWQPLKTDQPVGLGAGQPRRFYLRAAR